MLLMTVSDQYITFIISLRIKIIITISFFINSISLILLIWSLISLFCCNNHAHSLNSIFYLCHLYPMQFSHAKCVIDLIISNCSLSEYNYPNVTNNYINNNNNNIFTSGFFSYCSFSSKHSVFVQLDRFLLIMPCVLSTLSIFYPHSLAI